MTKNKTTKLFAAIALFIAALFCAAPNVAADDYNITPITATAQIKPQGNYFINSRSGFWTANSQNASVYLQWAGYDVFALPANVSISADITHAEFRYHKSATPQTTTATTRITSAAVITTITTRITTQTTLRITTASLTINHPQNHAITIITPITIAPASVSHETTTALATITTHSIHRRDYRLQLQRDIHNYHDHTNQHHHDIAIIIATIASCYYNASCDKTATGGELRRASRVIDTERRKRQLHACIANAHGRGTIKTMPADIVNLTDRLIAAIYQYEPPRPHQDAHYGITRLRNGYHDDSVSDACLWLQKQNWRGNLPADAKTQILTNARR